MLLMERKSNALEERSRQPAYESFPDLTPRRIGGEDSLENSSPTDSRSDEKVIVNEQRANKNIKTPSQTAVNKSEVHGNDDDIFKGA
jgi:hypothetical protein